MCAAPFDQAVSLHSCSSSELPWQRPIDRDESAGHKCRPWITGHDADFRELSAAVELTHVIRVLLDPQRFNPHALIWRGKSEGIAAAVHDH